MKLSKRKLESYRRVEIVAQASRLMMTAANPSKDVVDLWSAAVLDWMTVTGKVNTTNPEGAAAPANADGRLPDLRACGRSAPLSPQTPKGQHPCSERR